MKYFSSHKQIKANENFDVLELFKKIKSENSVILQSGLHGQYSIIGLNPLFVMKSPIYERGAGGIQSYENFLNDLEKKTKLFKLDLGLPFTGGAIGYFSYDFGVKLAEINQKNKEDMNVPEAYFMFPSRIIIFDHKKNILNLITWSIIKKESDKKNKILEELINSLLVIPAEAGILDLKQDRDPRVRVDDKSAIKSNLTKPQYLSKLKEIKKLLIEGETYQVNFSQRFQTETKQDPFEIYKKLTKINPSPYQMYFETRNFSIISNSPERLFKVSAKFHIPYSIFQIESRPIKGTTKRGTNSDEDKKLIENLLSSKKEQAELDMITDLVRNDLGRLCEAGTVEVNENRVIETYSHVHHTMSNVRGVLNPNINLTDILKSIFPGGSITGCPKIRTIQIIDKLEDLDRDVYCGSAGYIDGRGNMDFNIMIRTILALKSGQWSVNSEQLKQKNYPLITNHWSLFFHSGGGITIDSDPEKEWEETLHKAEAIKRSLI